jgi:hypothetical protein
MIYTTNAIESLNMQLQTGPFSKRRCSEQTDLIWPREILPENGKNRPGVGGLPPPSSPFSLGVAFSIPQIADRKPTKTTGPKHKLSDRPFIFTFKPNLL